MVTSLTNPLYFGCFWRSNDYNGYVADNKPAYNNFCWQANIGLKNIGSNGNALGLENPDASNTNGFNYCGAASVQQLVREDLSGSDADDAKGNLLDVTAGYEVELPYFSKSWADNHPTLMKYYDTDPTDNSDITFPFYEVTTTNTSDTSVFIKNGASLTGGSLGADEKARFYQFDSREANLQFSGFDADTHTGYFAESSTDIFRGYWDGGTYKSEVKSDRSNVGFFPLNSTNEQSGNTNNHNLGFGTKIEMDFQLESDGCVSAVKLKDGKYTEVDSSTRIHTIFEFTGDDDLWVFIDGNLVLDMGGAHYKSHGIIDFAARTATVDRAISLGGGSGKDDIGVSITTNAQLNQSSTPRKFTEMLSGTNTDTVYDIKETHTMTIFYMERGMLDSNLSIRYNYSPVPNFNRLKIAEVTKFDDVNRGLLDLTKVAAEDDVFKYTVSNTRTYKSDVFDNIAKYPSAAAITRTLPVSGYSGWQTTLNPYSTTGTPAARQYSPPGHDESGTWVDDYNTKSRVKNTSYLWVDKFASNENVVGVTTAGTFIIKIKQKPKKKPRRNPLQSLKSSFPRTRSWMFCRVMSFTDLTGTVSRIRRPCIVPLEPCRLSRI